MRPVNAILSAVPGRSLLLVAATLAAWSLALAPADAQVAVRGKRVVTMAGPSIEDGIVLVRDGKISAVGRAADISVPPGYQVLEAAVVTPGLVDAHSVVGLAGHLNQKHDQDQLEHSAPMQPELRALDAYNPGERLIEWVRGFGVTTLHTGHAPGELISGQTLVVKTTGSTVEDARVLEPATVAVTLGDSSLKGESKSPGTRGKQMALLRARLIQAQEYARKAALGGDRMPERDLGLDVLARVIRGELPLLVTAQRAQDIASALRLAEELKVRIILDGAAEALQVLDRIRAAGVPVILHPPMARASGELESASFETAGRLQKAGVTIALQSGYESYVPRTRVLLFEAAVAAANGLGAEAALAAITTGPARILGLDSRIGSLVVGKDGDLALFDGDPFEYTTHCTATVVEGHVVHNASR